MLGRMELAGCHPKIRILSPKLTLRSGACGEASPSLCCLCSPRSRELQRDPSDWPNSYRLKIASYVLHVVVYSTLLDLVENRCNPMKLSIKPDQTRVE